MIVLVRGGFRDPLHFGGNILILSSTAAPALPSPYIYFPERGYNTVSPIRLLIPARRLFPLILIVYGTP